MKKGDVVASINGMDTAKMNSFDVIDFLAKYEVRFYCFCVHVISFLSCSSMIFCWDAVQSAVVGLVVVCFNQRRARIVRAEYCILCSGAVVIEVLHSCNVF